MEARTLLQARKRAEQRARIMELEGEVAHLKRLLDKRAREAVEGINERNRLNVEIARLDGVYERKVVNDQ